MNGDARSPQQPSSSEAKRNLLAYGRVADAEIAAQVSGTLNAVRKALPWIGGIAAIAGFFLARRRKRSSADASVARPGSAPSRAMPGVLSLAMQLAPIALKLLLRTRVHKNEN